MANTHPEQAAAVIVCTVIYPGKTTSISGSPSAIIKVSPEAFEQWAAENHHGDLLAWCKAVLEIELNPPAPRATPGQLLDVGAALVEEAERSDPEFDAHTLGDEKHASRSLVSLMTEPRIPRMIALPPLNPYEFEVIMQGVALLRCSINGDIAGSLETVQNFIEMAQFAPQALDTLCDKLIAIGEAHVKSGGADEYN